MVCVFVVDDVVFMWMLVKKILIQVGYQVVGEVSNGKEVVEKYKQLKFDLVIMDIVMFEMDGIIVVKEIMKIDLNVKIIMIIVVGQEVKVMEVFKSGVKGYIVKLFQVLKVIEEVNRVFFF